MTRSIYDISPALGTLIAALDDCDVGESQFLESTRAQAWGDTIVAVAAKACVDYLIWDGPAPGADQIEVLVELFEDQIAAS